MRQTDDKETAKVYRGQRLARTVFGGVLAAAALVAFFLAPEPRDPRVDVGIAGAILLGGAYIDVNVLKELFTMVTPFLPRRD